MKSLSLAFTLVLLAGAAQAADTGNVARAQFTTGIDNREPLDNLTQLDNSSDQLWFFTEFTNASGERLTHRWEHNGEVMAEVGFDVGGDRWRVWSSKQLLPEWTGTWTVNVVDSEGTVLATRELVYRDIAVADEAVEDETAESGE